MLGRILATMMQKREARVCSDKSQFLERGMSFNPILFSGHAFRPTALGRFRSVKIKKSISIDIYIVQLSQMKCISCHVICVLRVTFGSLETAV
jgi:hypothetical protein